MNARRLVLVAPALVSLLATRVSALELETGEPRRAFLRGDANSDGRVDIGDPISTLNYSFLGGRPPGCFDAADANDDGRVDLGDVIFTLGFTFLGRRPPPAPGPHECGVDPSPDELPFCEITPCDDVVVTPSILADVDGDGDEDTVVEDPERHPNRSELEDGDRVRVGTADGRRVAGKGDVDGDPEDDEVIVEDPEKTPGEIQEIDLDGDGDPDIVVVGTGGGHVYRGTADVDGAGGDDDGEEIILEDPQRAAGASRGIDKDGDGDPDIIIVGTAGGETYEGTRDEDGDGEKEIILHDPNRPAGQRVGHDIDGDGDDDIVVIGTGP